MEDFIWSRTIPRLCHPEMPEEWVHGEVFVVRDPDFLVALDRYEECGPEDTQPTEFRRLAADSGELSSGESVEAWMYVYNRPVTDLRRIASGQFVAMTAYRIVVAADCSDRSCSTDGAATRAAEFRDEHCEGERGKSKSDER